MLDQTTRTAILRLRKAGHGTREIATALGISRGSVKRVLREGTADVPRLVRAERCEPHREQILQRMRQAEPHDRQRFIEALTKRGGGARVLLLQCASEVVEQALCGLHFLATVGVAHRSANRGVLAVGKVPQHVSHLVDLASLDQSLPAEDTSSGRAQALRAVDDEESRAISSEAANHEIFEHRLA